MPGGSVAWTGQPICRKASADSLIVHWCRKFDNNLLYVIL